MLRQCTRSTIRLLPALLYVDDLRSQLDVIYMTINVNACCCLLTPVVYVLYSVSQKN